MTTEQERAAVVSEAMTWVGTPYHHMGAKKGVGVDCAMILIEVYAGLGLIDRIDPRPYSAQFHLHHSEERYLSFLDKYSLAIDGNPLPGDVVTFRVGRCVAHAGIVIDWPVIVHAYAKAKYCVLEDVLGVRVLAKRIDRFLRINRWCG